MDVFHNDWDIILENEFEKDYYQKLMDFLNQEYRTEQIFPVREEIFQALEFTPYSKVKVVILGQDPYHGEGQSHGLAFSVKPGIKQPPSLVNIFKELNHEMDVPLPAKDYGYLKKWADQGVLLLNTCLTVRAHSAGSHRKRGWETFTDEIIRRLNQREKPMVFLLWGNNAREKKKLITSSKHLVLEGAHPSPLSAYRGFFGGKYFLETNHFLEKIGETPIDWDITEA